MLEGIFDADELEALAWWMHNKGEVSIHAPAWGATV
jgi:hypothetical protein